MTFFQWKIKYPVQNSSHVQTKKDHGRRNIDKVNQSEIIDILSRDTNIEKTRKSWKRGEQKYLLPPTESMLAPRKKSEGTKFWHQ